MSSAPRASSERRRRGSAQDPVSAGTAQSRSGGRPAHAVDVPLAHARWHHFGWLIFGLIAGVLLVLKLGIVGQIVGAVLLVVAIRHGIGFARTLFHPAGTIAVNESQVVLPRGLCRGEPVTVSMEQVHHAFVLRRAVPWTQTGPLLVIEADGRAFTYPRDWFPSEADQQRIIRALHHYLDRVSG